MGAQTPTVTAGRHRLRLNPRFDGHTLTQGSYRLVIEVQAGSGKTVTETVNLTVGD